MFLADVEPSAGSLAQFPSVTCRGYSSMSGQKGFVHDIRMHNFYSWSYPLMPARELWFPVRSIALPVFCLQIRARVLLLGWHVRKGPKLLRTQRFGCARTEAMDHRSLRFLCVLVWVSVTAAQEPNVTRCTSGAANITTGIAFHVQVCNLFGGTCYINHPNIQDCATESLEILAGECKLLHGCRFSKLGQPGHLTLHPLVPSVVS